eukprot:CAMPEP_0182923206 /NCGR_PEP_ID=MMETSP0105_2-20130417/5281_1 /TAXON_ID=81532 ORGANISM="Acanthoeca-like sp., Strain 10tr" /NCGR_SAMPLE_ID=MMETSP0105_2 /ASSEMBLY_ACC=CAM_ASM_000205 /LENGTH=89 /DNA_ID=CAMNT_0025060897 /DNA_START=237 /DNA_END=502 /DNA_ORIENTATION=+
MLRWLLVVAAVTCCVIAAPVNTDDTVIVEGIVTPEGEVEVVGSLQWFTGRKSMPSGEKIPFPSHQHTEDKTQQPPPPHDEGKGMPPPPL